MLAMLMLRSVSVYCESFILITILHFLHNSEKYSGNASNQCMIKHFIAKASKKFKSSNAQNRLRFQENLMPFMAEMLILTIMDML